MNIASDIRAVGNKVEIVLIKGDKEKIFNPSVEIVKRTPKRFVEDERHALVGSLWRVAKLLELGLLRIAKPDECLPSAAVMDRLRPTRLDHIVRVECEGRVVWGMRERCSYTSIIVVDENGKLVRKRSIKEAAEKAVREKAGW